MIVNYTRSKIVQFRLQSVQQTDTAFFCGDKQLEEVDKYTYICHMLNEHFDCSITVKAVAQSENRALGILIANCKVICRLPYDAFT